MGSGKFCPLAVVVILKVFHQIVVDASESFRLVFRTLGDFCGFCFDFLKLFLGEFGIIAECQSYLRIHRSKHFVCAKGAIAIKISVEIFTSVGSSKMGRIVVQIDGRRLIVRLLEMIFWRVDGIFWCATG